MKKELQKLLLKQQEEEYYHLPIEMEFSFYRDVQQGNLEILKGPMEQEPESGLGILSDSPLQNKKYCPCKNPGRRTGNFSRRNMPGDI